jgi:hypothetical protein
MPKTLNVSETATSSKQSVRSKTKAASELNALVSFLTEIGITEKDWNSAKDAMKLMAAGKMQRTAREVSETDKALSSRACVFWVRSKDHLTGERTVTSTSDRLVALVYAFMISQFVHRPMIDKDVGTTEQWLWDALDCRSSFERQINILFKSTDADWIWADHIPIPVSGTRPSDIPYLESFYEKQMKSFGASTLDHIEKLNAATKAIVTAAGRFPMTIVPDDVRTKLAVLTNEFVDVSVIIFTTSGYYWM